MHDLPRRVAQHARLVARGLMDGAVQIARLVNGVGIGEQQPAPARLARGCPDGVGLARPAVLEFGGLDHGHAGKAAGDLRGAVGGVVIDDDQFPVAAELEDIVRLRDERLQARAQVLSSLRAGMMTVSSISVSGSGWSKTVPAADGQRQAARRVHRKGPAPASKASCARLAGSPFIRHVACFPAFLSIPVAPYYKDVRFPRLILSGSRCRRSA